MKGQAKPVRSFDVILADDDAEDRLFFLEAFKDLNLSLGVNTVNDGAALLEYLNDIEHIPQIIFLDLNMPKVDGLTCLKEIRSNPRYKDVCIVIYSTSSNEDEIENCLVIGANFYIKKPSDFDKLKSMLYKVITFNGHCQKPHMEREFFLFSLA
jgi:CheY-like chemotaxis protein